MLDHSAISTIAMEAMEDLEETLPDSKVVRVALVVELDDRWAVYSAEDHWVKCAMLREAASAISERVEVDDE